VTVRACFGRDPHYPPLFNEVSRDSFAAGAVRTEVGGRAELGEALVRRKVGGSSPSAPTA